MSGMWSCHKCYHVTNVGISPIWSCHWCDTGTDVIMPLMRSNCYLAVKCLSESPVPLKMIHSNQWLWKTIIKLIWFDCGYDTLHGMWKTITKLTWLITIYHLIPLIWLWIWCHQLIEMSCHINRSCLKLKLNLT